MKTSIPWSVKGIDQNAREAAKDAARRAGMTVGEWLNQVIIDSGGEADEGYGRRRDDHPRGGYGPQRREADAAADDIGALFDILQELGERIDDAEERTSRSLRGLDRSVTTTLARLDDLEHDAETMKSMATARNAIEARLERLERDDTKTKRLDALKSLEGALVHVAQNIDASQKTTNERVEANEAALSNALERLETAEADSVSALDYMRTAMDRLAARVDASEARAEETAKSLEKQLSSIDARLGETGAAAAPDPEIENKLNVLAEELRGGGTALEDKLAKIATKIEKDDQRRDEAFNALSSQIDALRAGLQSRDNNDAPEAIVAAIADMTERLDALEQGVVAAPTFVPEDAPIAAHEAAPNSDREDPAPADAADEPMNDRDRQLAELNEAFVIDDDEPYEELDIDLEELAREEEAEIAARQNADAESLAEAPLAPALKPAPMHEQEDKPVADDALQEEPVLSLDGAPDEEPQEPKDYLEAARRAAQSASQNQNRKGEAPAPHEPLRAHAVEEETEEKPSGGLVKHLVMGAVVAAFVSLAVGGFLVLRTANLPSPFGEPEPATPVTATAEAPPAAVPTPTPVAEEPAGDATPDGGDDVAALEQAAAAGDPDALYLLGARELDAVDGGNVEKAAQMLLKAAYQNHAPAQFTVGQLYDTGRGFPKDSAAARRWHERAAKAGHAQAMHTLAVMFAKGEGGRKDLTEASLWFERAARRGLNDAQYNLGVLYEQGNGVPQDFAKAFFWYSIAAANGDRDAAQLAQAATANLSPARMAETQSEIAAWAPEPLDPQANGLDLKAAKPDPLVAEAQRLLTELGFDPGAPEGYRNNETASAVRKFEEQAGLPVAGEVTPALVQALKSALPEAAE